MSLTPANLVAGASSSDHEPHIRGVNPRTGDPLSPAFPPASEEEIHRAVRTAAEAATELQGWSPQRLAQLTDRIALELEADVEDLVLNADEETALGRTRLEGELARTTGQLRSFARMARSGWHLDATIDRQAAPDTGIRRMQVPLGPVAVFGASNFPLAFGVPGGDTASALIAGCPVIAKAHPSHPATSQLAGAAITRAVAHVAAPPGTFSLLHGGIDVGQALVTAEPVAAVGFTGSHQAGMALFHAAARRSVPIPVYAEMGSLNPAFVFPGAIAERADALALELAGSITQGGGQFCTKPGLIIVPHDADGVVQALKDALHGMPAQPLLNVGIGELLNRRVADSLRSSAVEASIDDWQAHPAACSPLLLEVSGRELVAHRDRLLEEHFGPVSFVVRHDPADWPNLASALPGSLAAAINAADSDLEAAVALQDTLIAKVGRIAWNSVTTGVAVVPSMQHGGPYPATTSPSSTSVGWYAVRRFLRPVAFQGAPMEALPQPLRDETMLSLVDSAPHLGAADYA